MASTGALGSSVELAEQPAHPLWAEHGEQPCCVEKADEHLRGPHAGKHWLIHGTSELSKTAAPREHPEQL